jgi:hypothetical protein
MTGLGGGAAPAAGAVRWTAARNLPGTAGAGFPFDVDVGPRGTAAIAFVNDGVQVVRRDARGHWHAPERVSPADASVTAPDIELTARREIVVAWTQAVGDSALPPVGPSAIRVAVRRRDGGWRGRAVGRTPHFIDAGLQLAVDARGDAAVVWSGSLRRTAAERLLLAMRPAGRGFRPARSLDEGAIDQRVALDERGRARLAWTRTIPPGHLVAQIRFTTCQPGGGCEPVETIASGRVGGPELAVVPDDAIVLGWRADEVGLGATRTGLPTVAVRTRGDAWSEPRALSDVRTPGLHLGVSGAAEVLATWTPAPPAYPEPAVRALYAASRPRGGDFGVVTRTADVLDGPLAVLADGSAVTVAAGGGIEGAARPPGGTFAKVKRLSRSGDFPSLSAWGRVALAVWPVGDRLRGAFWRAR